MVHSILHIPCKAESTRCPGKNMALINGRPSVCWVIEAAIASNKFDSIAISTDSQDVRDTVSVYPVQIAPQSPSTVVQTTHDILGGIYTDRITIILATAALIQPSDIIGALRLSTVEQDPVMIVTELPYRVSEIVKFKDGEVLQRPFQYYDGADDKPGFYIDAGALYTFPPNQFAGLSTVYVNNLRPYVVPRYRGVDVDYPEDLHLVRRLASSLRVGLAGCRRVLP